MKKTVTITYALLCLTAKLFGQDSQEDKSRIHETSLGNLHLLNLFTIHGAPKNHTEDSVDILINHGYCIGFSKKYNQPLWAAYQVSKVTRFKAKDDKDKVKEISKDVDYQRFPFFVDDARLPEANRIGDETFGGGYDLGHMVPNEAINRQYGKMSQMETFLMSNIAPQKAELNQGVWVKLEQAILNKYTDNFKDSTHVWILTGPVIGTNPSYITRKNGTKVAVPDSFFCILVRPARYHFGEPGNAQYMAFLFPQQIEKKQPIDIKYLVPIDRIEKLTGLNFFPLFTKNNEDKIEKNAATTLW